MGNNTDMTCLDHFMPTLCPWSQEVSLGSFINFVSIQKKTGFLQGIGKLPSFSSQAHAIFFPPHLCLVPALPGPQGARGSQYIQPGACGSSGNPSASLRLPDPSTTNEDTAWHWRPSQSSGSALTRYTQLS